MALLKYQLSAAKRFLSQFWNIPIGFSESPPLSDSDIAKILANWEIERINARKVLWGGSSSNQIIETPTGKYVLRNAGANRDYVDFQIFIINKLREHNFSYSIPQPLTAKGTSCVSYLGHFWLLYRFIEGHPLRTITAAQSEEIGRLMANYHTIARCIDYHHMGNFSLALFENETIHSVLREKEYPVVAKKTGSRLKELLSRSIAPILEAYNNIPATDKESIERLRKIPIYDDWHGHNLLAVNGKVIGLVDFDSLVTAPRIVDVQNGLLYAAGTNKGIDIPKLRAFVQGYCSVSQLAESEMSLIYPLMIDRITSLISDILVKKKTKNSRYKDDILIFFINVLSWTIQNKKEFLKHLRAASYSVF